MPEALRPGYVPPSRDASLSPETVADLRRAYENVDERGEVMVREWQQGRCAMCAGRTYLVMDHDHHTGLIRGQLCRPCNAAEGRRSKETYEVWQAYRDRNPAVMLGVKARYWNPLTQEYA